MCRRSFADRPVAGAALLGILRVAHAEVEIPCRSEEAHGLSVLEHLRVLLFVPDACGQRVIILDELIRLVHPGFDLCVKLKLVVRIHPRNAAVVGECAVGFRKGSGHVITLCLGILGSSVELVPAVQLCLHFCGIRGSQDILSDGAAVDQCGRAALEGNTLHDAGSVRCGLDRVLVRVGEIRDAQRGDILRRVSINILQNVISLCEEHIHFIVVGSIFLIQQSFIKLLLISAVVAGGDDPVHGDAVRNLVIFLKESLELFVPGVNIEYLSLGVLCCGSFRLFRSGSRSFRGCRRCGSCSGCGSGASSAGTQNSCGCQNRKNCGKPFLHMNFPPM